ncbi:hypothetical protein [Defluviimonas salinarum]|uniref:Uncharacterized protein n=1 Tax=Defluviimonas salinarum TaxID=2992147 RepID=A0ABT3J931_9RHOB|nr:hypothetical protein [Defluviimonas salinarum]MCW3784190.1 hypothetical protein [Defluviimonas salinarum]
MSNVHHLPGEDRQRSQFKSKKTRKEKATDADIARALRAALAHGLTVYAYTIEGNRVSVQTKPDQPAAKGASAEVDAWFAANG